MRPSWEEYFMEITDVIAARSTCLRRKVGAVIVRDNRILASGYNGPPRGLKHCDETGCLRDKMQIPSGERHELCRGLHAEQNVIIQAAMHGISIQDGTFYITHQPCILCAKMIINSGIKKVIYKGSYPDPMSLQMFAEAEVELICLDGEKQ